MIHPKQGDRWVGHVRSIRPIFKVPNVDTHINGAYKKYNSVCYLEGHLSQECLIYGDILPTSTSWGITGGFRFTLAN